jgi:hypothetical protein
VVPLPRRLASAQRLIRLAPAIALAALALAFGACGGDGNGGSGGSAGTESNVPQGSTGGSQEGANGGSSSGTAGDSSNGTKKGTSPNGDVPQDLELDDKSPAPSSGAKKGRGDEELPSGPPQPARDFTGLERQIYESSRFFCHRAGVEGMRKEYDIASKDPQDVAREAARRSYPRGFPEAVYSGCLTGLRQ